MTNTEAINWIINISADIGKAEHRALWHYEQALDEIREMLESAQPERMKGRWILHETMNGRYDDMICPFCRKSYTVDAYRIDDIGFTAEDFNFCPNCGAVLEVSRNETIL